MLMSLSSVARSTGAFVVLVALLLPGCARGEAPGRESPRAESPPDERPRVGGLRGRVVKVFDGDSFVMRSGDERVDVRVFGIDAPEKGQPFSQKARSRSRELLDGEEVVVRVTTPRDVHGRVVGEVFLEDGRSYAHVIVGEGLAWQFRRYSNDPAVAALERDAQRARRGLWRDRDPEPPWEFRRRKRHRS